MKANGDKKLSNTDRTLFSIDQDSVHTEEVETNYLSFNIENKIINRFFSKKCSIPNAHMHILQKFADEYSFYVILQKILKILVRSLLTRSRDYILTLKEI